MYSSILSTIKMYLNMTCTEYLNQYRLARALEALETTDLPVTTIALENGFNTVSYFNRQFKDKFHLTPREYRKHKKKEERPLHGLIPLAALSYPPQEKTTKAIPSFSCS
jgi:AraC-type DNA-binding domain-containing proteins